jgi:hypothetical protein
MDDIIKYDVRTYVGKLIEKEFSFKNKEVQVLPENCKTDASEHRKVQPSSVAFASMGRTASDIGG